MDQLDILKKDWNKPESSFQQLSQKELSSLIHKRSSSIVKWIFIISVLEFGIPLLVLLFTGIEKKSMQEYEKLGLSNFMIVFYAFTTLVIFYFIYRFYINYKSIDVYSSPKKLLQNILNTRKTVKHYIWFNLAMIPILVSVVLYKLLNSPLFLESLPADINIIIVVLLSFVVMLVLIGIVWLFYKLLYGVLLNRLNQNYNELVNSNADCD